MNQLFVIDGVSVVQFEPGMYRLNDLHQASGGKEKNKPSNFLRNKKTKIITSSIQRETFKKVHSIKGGKLQGTYVCRELLFAYSIWVDPEFYVKVLHSLSLAESLNKGDSQ